MIWTITFHGILEDPRAGSKNTGVDASQMRTIDVHPIQAHNPYSKYRQVIYSSGWWFGTMEFYECPFSWECHHPN